MRTQYELTKLLHARLDDLLSECGSTRKAAEMVGSIAHTWWNHRGRFNIATLIKIRGGVDTTASGLASELCALRSASHSLGEITEPLRNHMPKLLHLRRPLPHTAGNAESSIYVHAALQLETMDFPGGNLKAAIFDRAVDSAIEDAAIADLVGVFVNARFFSAFSSAIRLGEALPQHPFGSLDIKEPSHFDPSSLTINAPPRSMPPPTSHEILNGYTARDIFEQAIDGGATARLTALVTEINESDNDDFYDCLGDAVNFSRVSVKLTQPPVVLACACTATLKAELAALHAANTFRQAWYRDMGKKSTKLYCVASKIYEMCAQTYLLEAERMMEAISTLPGTLPPASGTFFAHRDILAYAYFATSQALMSENGLWFEFEAGQNIHLGFLSRYGSLLQSMPYEKGAPGITHRYGDESRLPTGYAQDSDILHRF